LSTSSTSVGPSLVHEMRNFILRQFDGEILAVF
jgi:hypothetical protein